MAPVIWGLNLGDMKWSAFGSKYMFGNTEFHMRRTKFIIYQCAMIFLVISESLGTAVLSDYLDQQNALQRQFPGINVYNNDYIGIASFNIFVGVFAAIVFGAGFFFDLFFPDRYEPRWVQNMWMGGAIFSSIAGLGDALAYTVILCLHHEKLTNYDTNDPVLIEALDKAHNKTPILYKRSGRAIASVVFLWIGWVCAVARYAHPHPLQRYSNCDKVLTLCSTIVMIMFYRYYRQYGTAKSTHARKAEDGKFGSSPSGEKASQMADPVADTDADRPNQHNSGNTNEAR